MKFWQAINFRTLYKGLKASCRNVRWKDTIVGYEANALKNTLKLLRDLRTGKYKISQYMFFTIFEPKKRDIVATRVRDRQFHHAFVDEMLYEEITRSFVHENCASQVGRGIDYCLKLIKAGLRRYYVANGNEGWVLKCDIHHFFESILHDVAKDAVAKRVKDPDAREYAFELIDSYEGDRGLGLGSQPVQLIALAVLDDLDHFIKEQLKIKVYVRYNDDFILVHPDKSYLQYCRMEIDRHLHGIGLKLNHKTQLSPLKDGFRMLKWRIVLTDSGHVLIRMDQKKLSKQRKHIRKLWALEKSGRVKEGACKDSMRCWMANAKRGDTFRYRTMMARFFYDLTGGISFHEYGKPRKKGCPPGKVALRCA